MSNTKTCDRMCRKCKGAGGSPEEAGQWCVCAKGWNFNSAHDYGFCPWCGGVWGEAPKKEPKDAEAGTFVHPGTPTLWLCECCGARAEGFFDDPPPKGWQIEPSLLCPECAGGYDYARKIQEETERRCSCPQLLPGLDALHRSCKMAAMNGTPIKLPDLKYCPWCGGRIGAGQRYAENEKAEETEAPTAPALSDTCCICEGKIKTCPHGTATRVKVCQ